MEKQSLEKKVVDGICKGPSWIPVVGVAKFIRDSFFRDNVEYTSNKYYFGPLPRMFCWVVY